MTQYLPQERASLAVQLSNSIVMAARNAMQDVNAAAQLNLTHPLRTYAEWVSHFGSKEGGSKLYGDIIDAVVAQTKKPDACFVAGTLVHTQEGLVAIEKIKVGDYVLSKPENGEGEQSYQRVSKTFVHEAQEVICVDVDWYTVQQGREAAVTGNPLAGGYLPFVVTANHPFWVVGKGWVEAERLRPGKDVLEFADGSQHQVADKSRIIRTLQEDIGFLIRGVFCPIVFTESKSRAVDLSGNSIHVSYKLEDEIENDGVEWWEELEEDRLRRTVYNLEVENTHTYYVGEQGVWVHNKLPSGVTLD
jgi:Pretoxin HINT domain